MKRADLKAIPETELRALEYVKQIRKHIKAKGGRFLQDERGQMHLSLGCSSFPINYSRDNTPLASLVLEVCKVTTLDRSAQAAIQRLQVAAADEAAKTHLRSFSACSKGRERLYLPEASGKLLQISRSAIELVSNGDNPDNLWVEHPRGEPFNWTKFDPSKALAIFEELCVDTQACDVSEMRWFIAMAEGLFPYIRDQFPARFITAHIGPSQQAGKTSGAERFTRLHGLGTVLGDYSVAALGNMRDLGLLVLDNKEQANFSRDLVDYCLFLATGAERGRSDADGNVRRHLARPAAVITSIEGVSKAELQNRTVEVEYLIKGEKLRRAPIEHQIEGYGRQILSAFCHVLQRFMGMSQEGRETPNPLQNFEEHFTALCDLLRAYAEVARKPAGWAEQLINAWDATLTSRETDEEELETPLLTALNSGQFPSGWATVRIEHEGRWGRLCVGSCSDLLSHLRTPPLRDVVLPKNANGLSRRLHSARFKALRILDDEARPDLEVLRRTGDRRVIGIFIPDQADGMTAMTEAA